MGPVHLVITSAIACIVALIIILFAIYIYPKKKNNFLFFLIIIAILPTISMLRNGPFESGGFNDYAKFAISFYTSLSEGNLIPQWDNLRCAGFGCPQFLFMYTLPYYAMSLFHFLGLNFINSEKLLLAVSYIGSGLTMYLFVRSWLNDKAAFVAAIFYLFAPYHLVDLHFRTDIDECLSFVLLPLQFYFTKKIIDTSKTFYVLLAAFNLLLLILSHQAISLTSIPILFLYAFFIWRQSKPPSIKKLLFFISSLILGLLFSLFYWLPIVLEARDIWWGIYGNVTFISPITMFIYSPWRLGFLYQGHHGELSFIVGYIHLLIIAVALIMLWRNRIEMKLKSLLIFFLCASLILFLFMQPFTKPIWDWVPLMNKFEFSYRFLLFIAFLTSCIAGIIAYYANNNKILFILCFFTIIITILNWGNRKTIPTINDQYLSNELQTNDAVEVTIPIWASYSYDAHPPKRQSKHANILAGTARISEIDRNSTKHEYVIDALTNVVIQDNTFYFPGWKVYVNNNLYPFSYQNPSDHGIITFHLKKGLYKVVVVFQRTAIVLITQLISLITFILVLIYCLVYFIGMVFSQTAKKGYSKTKKGK